VSREERNVAHHQAKFRLRDQDRAKRAKKKKNPQKKKQNNTPNTKKKKKKPNSPKNDVFPEGRGKGRHNSNATPAGLRLLQTLDCLQGEARYWQERPQRRRKVRRRKPAVVGIETAARGGGGGCVGHSPRGDKSERQQRDGKNLNARKGNKVAMCTHSFTKPQTRLGKEGGNDREPAHNRGGKGSSSFCQEKKKKKKKENRKGNGRGRYNLNED